MKCTRDFMFGRSWISAVSLRRKEPREIERKIHTNHASCNFFCHFFCKGVKFGSCRIAGYGNICISLEGFDVGGACALGLQAND